MALNSKTFNWNKKYIKNYFEIYLDVPIDELQKRDPKGIYKNFSKGLISNVAGLDLKFDKPKTQFENNLETTYETRTNSKKIFSKILK